MANPVWPQKNQTHTMLKKLLPMLALAGVLGSCNTGSRGGAVSAAANATPTVQLLSQISNAEVIVGTPVEIRFLANDPDSEAKSEILAVPTTGPKKAIKLASNIPEQDGVESLFVWDTTAFKLGDWRIEVRCFDGKRTGKAQSAGVIRIASQPPPPGASGLASAIEGQVGFGALKRIQGPAEGVTYFSGLHAGPITLNAGNASAFSIPGPESSFDSVTSDGGNFGSFIGAFTDRFTWARAILGDGVSIRSASRFGPDRILAIVECLGASITFSAGQTDETTVANQPGIPLFVTYGTNGAFLGTAPPVNIQPNLAYIHAVRPGPDGSLLLTGFTAQTHTIAPGTSQETVLQASDDLWGAVILKISSTGLLESAAIGRVAVPTHSINIHSVFALPNGELIVLGDVLGTVRFGKGAVTDSELTSPTMNSHLFVVRLNADGQILSKYLIGSSSPSVPEFLDSDVAADGSLLMLIEPDDAEDGFDVTFGVGTPEASVFNVDPAPDTIAKVIVARLSPTGGLIFVRAGSKDLNALPRFCALPDGGCALAVNSPEPATCFGPNTSFPVFDQGIGRLGLLIIDPLGNPLAGIMDGGVDMTSGDANLVFPTDIALYNASTLIVFGSYLGNATIGLPNPNAVTLPELPNGGAFVATFGLNGSF